MNLQYSSHERFERAYEKYADMLYRIAMTHTSRSEDAEDAVHDVFIKYNESPMIFSDDEHERAWLIRVTINRCRDLVRRRQVRSYVTFDEVGDIPEEADDTPDVITTVKALPEKYRDTVVLHYLEGYSVEECAKILKLTSSAVKMRLARGREMLKNIIEKEEGNV